MAILKVKQADGTWAEIPAIAGEKGKDGYTPQKGIDYFDGSNGKDGTSVTVSSVTESTVDGGSNVVAFSDGKSVTIKNGSKGNPGYTPQKNVDYFDGQNGQNGKDGVSATHSWNGTTLTVSSASGTSSANLKGDKGDTGEVDYSRLDEYAKKSDIPTVPVTSVNGKTGAVQLGASDVGARPNTWTPSASDVGARPNTWMPSANDVGALPTSGGKMTGKVSFEGENALPPKYLQYVCGIDGFKDGGEMGWQSKSEFLSGYATQSWVEGKGYLTALPATENWTFTLEDGSTVTKAVYVG